MITSVPQFRIVREDDQDVDTWENEGGATCLFPPTPTFTVIHGGKGWDVFDPRDGVPMLTVRWRWMARLITWRSRCADYAPTGEGWL